MEGIAGVGHTHIILFTRDEGGTQYIRMYIIGKYEEQYRYVVDSSYQMVDKFVTKTRFDLKM